MASPSGPGGELGAVQAGLCPGCHRQLERPYPGGRPEWCETCKIAWWYDPPVEENGHGHAVAD